MDANKDSKGEEDEQSKQKPFQAPASQSKEEAARRRSVSSISSLDSQDSALSTVADDRPSSDMDGVGDAYRRRRAQLMAGLGNGNARGKRHGRRESRRLRGDGSEAPDDKHQAYSTDDGHDSDFSSMSISDDVELNHFASGDALTDDEETGLTKKDKEHRKRKRRRNVRLDGRVAGDVKASKEQRDADRNVLKAMVINVLLIMAWYLFSLSISIVSKCPARGPLQTLILSKYNKWMFTEKYLNFHFPLFTTCLHMLVQFCLATLVLYFIPQLRPRPDSITNPHNHYSVRRDSSQDEKPLMTRMFYITRIGPCGAATGLDIGLGNMSLKFITLTFYSRISHDSHLL